MANCECHNQMVIRNHMLYYIMICLDVRLPLQNEDSTMVGSHCGTIIPINFSFPQSWMLGDSGKLIRKQKETTSLKDTRNIIKQHTYITIYTIYIYIIYIYDKCPSIGKYLLAIKKLERQRKKSGTTKMKRAKKRRISRTSWSHLHQPSAQLT